MYGILNAMFEQV